MPVEPFFGFNKVGYLQALANTYGDFRVAKGWKGADGEIHWSKHYTVLECWQSQDGLKFLAEVNNRGGLANELRIDIDAGERTPEEVRKQFDDACNTLERFHMDYLGFTSGSRGYHIHQFVSGINNNPLRLKEAKGAIIRLLGGELLKVNDSPMLTLEWAPNNKTGNLKIPIRGSQVWLDVEK